MGRVAYVVSPHGFGHAARACAVMAEMRRRRPALHFEVFTEVPEWFFSDSLPRCFSYHLLSSDVGLVQSSPLIEDFQATVDRLDEMWNDSTRPRSLGRRLRELECSMVMVDISPLGLAAAYAVSLPTVLVENFTWDWIYGNHPDAPPELRDYGRRMEGLFTSTTLRIQSDPICQSSPAAFRVPPVARRPRSERESTRAALGIGADEAMIVVSMGGVPWDYRVFSELECADGAWIVVPGGSESGLRRRGRLILLPFHADFYHPDLVAASDVVVSKLGYSTVAEAFRAGVALAYVGRPRFPESPVLARWVEEHMVSAEITAEALRSGECFAAAEELLKAPRETPGEPNGAIQAAEAILERFGSILD
jgi:UDP:flavonoid glycosyltransferase YjiC (YdhE family)